MKKNATCKCSKLKMYKKNLWVQIMVWRCPSHYLNQGWLNRWRIYAWFGISQLTHRGRVTHICVSKLTIIGSDNGLSPGRRQAIIWTNDGILSIGPLGTHFGEILSETRTFSFKKMHLKISSGKWRPFCLGLNVLIIDLIHILHNSFDGNGAIMNETTLTGMAK